MSSGYRRAAKAVIVKRRRTVSTIIKRANRSTMNDSIDVEEMFSNGETKSVTMGIAAYNAASILDELTDLSSDRGPYAVREAISNAYDATKSAGSDAPIEVTIGDFTDTFAVFAVESGLPSDSIVASIIKRLLDRDGGYGSQIIGFISITDHGVGMCEQDGSLEAFYQYGGSSKSGATTIGSKGLGAKAPLAVSDWFDVVTARKGVKTHMHLYRSNGENKCDIVGTNECPSDEHGTTVIIPFVKRVEFDRAQRCLYDIAGYSYDCDVIINGERVGSEINNLYVYVGRHEIGCDEDGDPIKCGVWYKRSGFPNNTYGNVSGSVALNMSGYTYDISAYGNGEHADNGEPNVIIEGVPGLFNFTISRDGIKLDDQFETVTGAIYDMLGEIDVSSEFLAMLRDKFDEGGIPSVIDKLSMCPKFDSTSRGFVDASGAKIKSLASVRNGDLVFGGVNVSQAIDLDARVRNGVGRQLARYSRSKTEFMTSRFARQIDGTLVEVAASGRSNVLSAYDSGTIVRKTLSGMFYDEPKRTADGCCVVTGVDTKELFHKLVSVDKYIPEAIGTDSQWHSVLACEGDVTDPVDLALIELFGIKKIDVTSLIDSCVSLRKSNTRRTKYDIVSNEPFDNKDSFVIDCARKALIPSVIIPSVTFNDGNACFTHVTPGDADGGSDDASVTSLIDAIDGCDYTIDAIARASAMVCSTQFYKGDMRDALSIEGATLASVDAPDTCAVYVPYPSYRTNIAVTLGMFLVMRKLGYVDPQITKVAFIYSSDFNKQMFRKATANVPVLDVSDKSGFVGEFIDASNVAPAPCGLYFNKQPRTGHVVYVCDAKGETIPLSDEAMRKLANTVLSESVSGSYGVGYTGASTICKMLEKFFGQRMFAPEMSDDSLRCRCDDLQYGDSFVKINTSACSMPDLKSDVKAFMLGMSNSGSLEVLRKLTDESGRNTADAYCADAMRTFVRECVEHLYDEHLAKYGWRENGLDDDGAGDESEVLYSAD